MTKKAVTKHLSQIFLCFLWQNIKLYKKYKFLFDLQRYILYITFSCVFL